MKRSTFIIVAADKATADQAAIDHGFATGPGSFSAPLVPAAGNGSATATHYGCSGIVEDDEKHAALAAIPGIAWYRATDGIITGSHNSLLLGDEYDWLIIIAAESLQRRAMALA